mmetsp:Transcript_22372/g.66658  ORF Transcript_22372/g.66658 Transcript_22372/m.66658 type:complete len:280 (-) Transcript_22372:174-1013(-)
MVQVEPNLVVAFKNFAPFGAVVSAEQQAALDHSITMKRVEAGLTNLSYWGKVTTLNGKDYMICEGYNDLLLGLGGEITVDSKFYYSIDGVKWMDLPAIDGATASRAANINALLAGDAAKAYHVEEDGPIQTASGEDTKDPAAEPGEGERVETKLTFSIPELAVLRQRVDAINTACGVIPVNAFQPNAANRIELNRLFSGVAHPDKLESYMHRSVAPGGRTLASDLRGSWAINYDPFRQIAAVRSLLFPGYTFCYSGHDAMWGSLYCGDGICNNELMFML